MTAMHTKLIRTRHWSTCQVEREETLKAKALADSEGRTRSATVRNPKDKYGFRAMSPFKASEFETRIPVGFSHQFLEREPCYRDKPRAILTNMPDVALPAVTRDMSPRGQTDALLAMRAEQALKQQDINVLQFAAFLPSTLRNIKQNAKDARRLLSLLHDRTALRIFLRGTPGRSLYLQWLFVWNQLYRDIVGGAAFLQSQARPIGSLVTGRASAKDVVPYSVRDAPAAWDVIGNRVCDGEHVTSQRAVSVARVTCDVSYGYHAVGLDNPMYLAWDLLRWTWVIDQLVDVGLFIESLTSMHGLEHLGTSVTTRVTNECVVHVEEHYNPKSGVRTVPVSWSPGYSRRKTVTRNVYGEPTRTITIRNPFLNSTKVTAAVIAALSLQLRGERRSLEILRLARA